MNLGIVIQIAKTHLVSRLKQSIIASLGVTFGISMFIAMVSFMTGVNKFMDDLMLDNTPHIHIYNDIKNEKESIIGKHPDYSDHMNVVHHIKPSSVKRNIRHAEQIIRLLRKDKKVLGVAPSITTQVFYTSGSNEISANIIGVEILEEEKLFKLSDNMQEGNITDLLTLNNALIMGAGLAKKLGIDVNDRVTITSPAGGTFQLTVVGLFKTGIQALDEGQSYSTIKTAQRIIQKGNSYITDIKVKLWELDEAAELASECERQFEARAVDYDTANAQFQVGNKMRNIMTYAVAMALLIVAGFGIYNILTMMIYEKMNDIAILKATGFSGKDIKRIFISEAMIIGLFGGSLGLLFGFLMSYGIASVPFKSDTMISMDGLPVNFDPYYYMIGIIFALVTTFFAGYLPARKASKLDPVTIIRGK